MKSRVIFASLILVLGVTASASAATIATGDSPVVSTSVSVTPMLINGSEKQFAQYIETKFSRFARRSDWSGFKQVVEQYNQNPVSVVALDADARQRFNTATTQVVSRMAKENSAESLAFMGQTDRTARMINFLWDWAQTGPETEIESNIAL
jgi:hypothetical protein